jgi:hypothetical protein
MWYIHYTVTNNIHVEIFILNLTRNQMQTIQSIRFRMEGPHLTPGFHEAHYMIYDGLQPNSFGIVAQMQFTYVKMTKPSKTTFNLISQF